jgi:hypothetical protein
MTKVNTKILFRNISGRSQTTNKLWPVTLLFCGKPNKLCPTIYVFWPAFCHLQGAISSPVWYVKLYIKIIKKNTCHTILFSYGCEFLKFGKIDVGKYPVVVKR